MKSSSQPIASEERHKIVIIGSGFGGTMAGLSLARALHARKKGESILILERGTWWTTPVGTVADKEVITYDFLRNEKKQPVQFWSSLNHFRGFLDIFTRCLRRSRNMGGLYQVESLGKRPLLGLFGGENDGVSVVRASGVGGGSLVYSNITIRPPELIFADERWKAMAWQKRERDEYYELARQAISVGVIHALNERAAKGKDPNFRSPDRISGRVSTYVPNSSLTLDSASVSKTYAIAQNARIPADMRINDAVWLEIDSTGRATSVERQGPFKVNTGLSNILGRTAAVPADSRPGPVKPGAPFNPRGIKQLIPDKKDPAPPEAFKPYDDSKDALWIDRARVFQTAVSKLTSDYGAVDLAINDLQQEPQLFEPAGNPKNYCERQGRCNVGCLPGARHTLNKQLMVAALGKPNLNAPSTPAQFDGILSITPLCEVDYVQALPEGGCRINYVQHAPDDSPQRGQKTQKTVIAEKVIISAGCLGTNELLLRSRTHRDAHGHFDGLPDLSEETGLGFSTNGDYIGFLEEIKERVTLTRGPVTTSFAHMNTDDSGEDVSGRRFHTIEDQGVPPALASVVGVGVPLIRSLGKGRGKTLFVLWAIVLWAINRVFRSFEAFFKNAQERQDFFKSAEEITGTMMCVVAQGRESAAGKFRLAGGSRETALRVKRTDGKQFYEDGVYKDIEASLNELAKKLAPTAKEPKFINPLNATSVPSPHPLGGCRIAEDVSKGVVDELGRVFKKNAGNPKDVYQGLY